MAIYEFDGYRPTVHESSFIHPLAAVVGNVTIGKNVYVGPNAAIRADFGEIIIKDGCNVQESCTVHMFPGITVTLEENAHIGHGAVVHGANISKNSLVGMNAVVMDHVKMGPECIIGALCFVPEGMEIPKRKVVVGNPAKIVKTVTKEMIAWKSEGTRLYQELAKTYLDTFAECEPLRRPPTYKKPMTGSYVTLGKTKQTKKKTTRKKKS